MCVRCPLALSKRQMSTRPVMPAKPTGAQSALFNGLSSGTDVSGGPDTSVVPGPYGLFGEDFSFVTEKIPAAMAMLGCAPMSGPKNLHTAEFDFDEGVLPFGAAYLAEVVMRTFAAGVNSERRGT